MTRKRKGNPVNGWVNFDKPLGMTSTQAVGKIRFLFGAQKAGHAGTLDPLATGVLPIALGEATKTVPYAQDAIKTYTFTVRWGAQTTTDDTEGAVIAESLVRPVLEQIQMILPSYIGKIMQNPPQFSAIKIDGQRAYDLAREGHSVNHVPRETFVEQIEVIQCREDEADFRVICGKGTYVRSLARDMAIDLGTYGHVSALRRCAVGAFKEEGAISLDKLTEMDDNQRRNQVLLPLQAALDDIPALALTEYEAAGLRNGKTISLSSRPDVDRLTAAGLGPDGEIRVALGVFQNQAVGLIEVEGVSLHPVRLFNLNT